MYEELIKALREKESEYPYWCVTARHDLLQAADAIEALSKPKWISVEERLPKESGEYIVYIKDPETCPEHDLSYVTSVFYDKDACLWREWVDQFYCANLKAVDTTNVFHITYWMPLPEPPKEG